MHKPQMASVPRFIPIYRPDPTRQADTLRRLLAPLPTPMTAEAPCVKATQEQQPERERVGTP